MRAELSTAIKAVLAQVDDLQANAPADSDTTDRLVNIATLAVRCRSAVERDGYTREVTLIPEAEAPARLALVLLRLLNALLAIGTDHATAWTLVTKCALDSMPAVRRTVLEDLMGREAPSTTSELAERVSYPTTTARRSLEDLAAHGIVIRQAGGAGRSDRWQPSDWTRDRWPTVPEKSQDAMSEHEKPASTGPISLPLRVFDDFSGTLPEDAEGAS